MYSKTIITKTILIIKKTKKISININKKVIYNTNLKTFYNNTKNIIIIFLKNHKIQKQKNTE